MTSAFEVAKYLIQLAASEGKPEGEPEFLTPLRVQKLLYYAQGWHLAFTGEPLFAEPIEAWIHGPVVRKAYARFAKCENQPIPPQDFADVSLSEEQKAFVASIWERYKCFSAIRLRTMTHSEPPWCVARRGLSADAPSQEEISQAAMLTFFAEQAKKHQKEGLEFDRIRSAEEEFRSGGGIDYTDLRASLHA